MKKFIVVGLLYSAGVLAATQGAPDQLTQIFCNDSNRSPVISILNRVEKERRIIGSDSNGVATLLSTIKSNSQLSLTEETLRTAGLSDAEMAEILEALQR